MSLVMSLVTSLAGRRRKNEKKGFQAFASDSMLASEIGVKLLKRVYVAKESGACLCCWCCCYYCSSRRELTTVYRTFL